MTVRNEEDILRINVLYHLATGIDRFLIVDNGSEDATATVLRELGRDPRVLWSTDPTEYRQPERLTEMALEALRRGAAWVVPIDADEFWYVRGASLKDVLGRSNAGALGVRVLNFIQSRHVRVSRPEALEWMTRRVRNPVGPKEIERDLVESRAFAYVETRYPPKWMARTSPELWIGRGNHYVTGVSGESLETDLVVCLHAPLRSRAALDKKADDGERIDREGWPEGTAWHVRRWAQLRREGLLEREWEANSYLGQHLHVHGIVQDLVFDATLLRCVAPFI